MTGGAIATSSLLYLVLPIIMGLLLRYTRLSLGWATVIFVPLVGVVIWIGQYIPLDVGPDGATLPAGAVARGGRSSSRKRFGTCCSWATA